jgi:hypothetical protein
MTRRALIAAVVGVAAVLGVIGVTHEADARPRRRRAPRPKISQATANPTRVAGIGGAVRLTVSIVPNGNTISSVTATPTGGGAGSASALTAQGNNTYQGSVFIGANQRTSRARVKITIKVTGNNGTATAVRYVTQDAGGTGGGDGPPPPPPI